MYLLADKKGAENEKRIYKTSEKGKINVKNIKKTTADEAYKKYHDLLNEPVKPLKKWILSDEKLKNIPGTKKLKNSYESFRKWFNANEQFNDKFGIRINTGRGTLLLRASEWEILRDAFLARVRKAHDYPAGVKRPRRVGAV